MFNWLRNLMMVIILVAIIILSFWISFLIGKRMIVPVKKIPTQYLLTEEARPLFPPEITLEVQGVTLEEIKPIPVKAAVGAYTVQLGAFSNRQNAADLAGELKEKGFPSNVKSSGRLYKVFSGSFNDLAEARAYLNKIIAAGYEGIVRRIN
jgi:cell division protein FtsN